MWGVRGLEGEAAHIQCDPEHGQQIDSSHIVLQKIAQLYAERLLSDITLDVGGRLFPAHRLILCASSNVFQVMLMNPSWSEAQESRISLKEEPQCQQVFGDFLHYLYTGRVHLNHEKTLPLLRLADKYNVKDLVQHCTKYLCMHVSTAVRCGQLVSWLHYTQLCCHGDVFTTCNNFAIWNFELLARSPDFHLLDLDLLVAILSQSDMVVRDETTVFKHAAEWLDAQEQKLDDPQEFSQLVVEVLSHVRFPMMAPRQLVSLLLHPFATRFKDFMVEQMRLAMAFQSHRAVPPGCSPASLTPRLYTAEAWSVPWALNNYSLIPIYGVNTLVFSTPASLLDCDGSSTHDWVLDFYPKGIYFKRFYLILGQGSLEMPEYVYKTVRLSLTLKDTTDKDVRVMVGILFYNVQEDGKEHVTKVIKKHFVFSNSTRMLNIDDLIPYDELNDHHTFKSPYLSGECLHLQFVITPSTS